MSEISGSLSVLVPLLCWSFLPQILTCILLTLLYSSAILSPPTTQREAWWHKQSVRAFCVISYLIYSLHETVARLQPSYYSILGLPLFIKGEDTKRAFRALARKYHPDKVGPKGEAFFINLRNAHDVLSEPVKRFAYDRFGSQVVEWRECTTTKEYVIKGVKASLGFYIVNPAMVALAQFFGHNSGGGYFWRLALLMLMFSVELTLLTSSTNPTILTLLLPNTTIHSLITLLHSFFTTLLLASQQLAPILAPNKIEDEIQTLYQLFTSLDGASNHLVVESLRVVADGTRSLAPHPPTRTT